MGQTPEQKEATNQLAEAIQSVLKTYDWRNKEMITTDWMVIVGQEGYDEDGDVKSAYTLLYPQGSMANHRVLGLIEAAKIYVAKMDKEDDE